MGAALGGAAEALPPEESKDASARLSSPSAPDTNTCAGSETRSGDARAVALGTAQGSVHRVLFWPARWALTSPPLHECPFRVARGENTNRQAVPAQNADLFYGAIHFGSRTLHGGGRLRALCFCAAYAKVMVSSRASAAPRTSSTASGSVGMPCAGTQSIVYSMT